MTLEADEEVRKVIHCVLLRNDKVAVLTYLRRLLLYSTGITSGKRL